jgi:hypothetical protein
MLNTIRVCTQEETVAHQTTAGRLLRQLFDESETARDVVAMSAGVALDRATAAMRGEIHLTLSEQLRLSEATALLAPRFSREASRLRAQVFAARSYEQGDVDRTTPATAERWERSAQMRR